MTTKIPFSIQKSALKQYLYWTNLVGMGLFTATMYGMLSIPIILEEKFALRWLGIHAVWMSLLYIVYIVVYRWYAEQYANGLRYELDGETLRVHQGVFNLERKAIPLDRVTDIMMTQGIVMRWLGIWRVDVQTAGMGGMMGAEGTMHAIAEPKHIRDTLLAARSQLVKGQLSS
ncbi:MAG: PH domain-containing protein [Candidatus Promineifilaceae bacterium]